MKDPYTISSKVDELEKLVPSHAKDAFILSRRQHSLQASRRFGVKTTGEQHQAMGVPLDTVDTGMNALTLEVPPPPYNPQSKQPDVPGTFLTPSVPPLHMPTPSRAVAGPSSPAPSGRSGASPAPIVVDGEYVLEMLRDFDTVFIVDDSASMRGTRWDQAKAAIKGVVAQAMKYDDDGVDIYFLNNHKSGEGLRKPKDVDRLFTGVEPRGATPTGRTLEKILRPYMAKLEAAAQAGRPDSVMPVNIIVITDGAPTDDPESVIISFARRLDKGDFPLSQVGIQMLQVGDDPAATRALQELDDELADAHGIRDMVDTVPYQGDFTAELIVKTLLGGINRRLDRRG